MFRYLNFIIVALTYDIYISLFNLIILLIFLCYTKNTIMNKGGIKRMKAAFFSSNYRVARYHYTS